MWKQACDLFTLVVFFSKSQWRRSVSHLLFSSSLFCFCSDVDGVIWCLSHNLYQQRTIIVNLVTVYKVQRLAAGLCSLCLVFLRLCFLFFCMCFMCLRVSWECVFEEHGVCVAERSSGCHRGVLLCKAGASLINVCWCWRLQRCEGCKGPVVIYCCVCAQQRILGLQMALQPVMNEH